MTRMRLLSAIAFGLVYEGEDPPNPTPTPTPTPSPTPSPTPTPTPTYTKEQQDHLNSLLAKERKAHERKNEELKLQLQTKINDASTSEEDRVRLQQRVEELQTEFKTKEQLAEQKSSQKLKEEKEARERAEAKAQDNWKLFERTRIRNDILSVASGIPGDDTKPAAYNPDQIVEILEPKTKLVAVKDAAGNAIPGQYVTKITLPSKDKDGKPVTLELTPPEAIEQLAKQKESANLFISGVKGGLGGGTLARGKQGEILNERDNPPLGDGPAYREWRKKHGPLAGRHSRR